MLSKATRSLQGKVAQWRISKSIGAMQFMRWKFVSKSCSTHEEVILSTSIARSQYGNSFN